MDGFDVTDGEYEMPKSPKSGCSKVHQSTFLSRHQHQNHGHDSDDQSVSATFTEGSATCGAVLPTAGVAPVVAGFGARCSVRVSWGKLNHFNLSIIRIVPRREMYWKAVHPQRFPEGE